MERISVAVIRSASLMLPSFSINVTQTHGEHAVELTAGGVIPLGQHAIELTAEQEEVFWEVCLVGEHEGGRLHALLSAVYVIAVALRREAAVLENTEVVVLSVDVPADLYLGLQQALWERKTKP